MVQTTSEYLSKKGSRPPPRKKVQIDRQLVEEEDTSGEFCFASVLFVDTDHTFKPRVAASHTSPFIRSILSLCHPYRQIFQSLVIPISACTNIDYSLMEGGALQLTTGPPAAQLWFQDLNPQLQEFLSTPHPAISA